MAGGIETSIKQITPREASERLAKLVLDIDRILKLPPDSPEFAPLREMLEKLNAGLPPATSGKLLSSRCAW